MNKDKSNINNNDKKGVDVENDDADSSTLMKGK